MSTLRVFINNELVLTTEDSLSVAGQVAKLVTKKGGLRLNLTLLRDHVRELYFVNTFGGLHT